MPPLTSWLAVRFVDPGGLLGGPHAASILRAHHEVIRAALGAAAPAAVDPHDATAASFPSAREAVEAAVRVQARTRDALAAAVQPEIAPRLQVATGVATTEGRATELANSAAGGQLRCDRAIHHALQDEPGLEYVEWGATSRGDVVECLYDNSAALLNAPFERMFAEEIRGWVRPLRETRAAGSAIGLPFPERPDTRNALFGVALSGGGMRSAVFSLGVLQAMSRYGLLREADYLSTASGGGYTGASLTSLCLEPLPYEDVDRLDCTPEGFPFAFPRSRPQHAAESADAARLEVHGNESPALHHVRGRATLLGQGIGLFSAYTWEMISRFIFATLALWLLFLLPTLTLLALAGIWAWPAVEGAGRGWWLGAGAGAFTAALAAALLTPVLRGSTTRWTWLAPARALVAVLYAAALLLAAAFLVTGLTWAARELQPDRLPLLIGSVAAALSGGLLAAGMRRLWTPDLAKRLLPVLAVTFGGYILLGLVVFGWFWALWLWTDGDVGARFLLAGAAALVLFAASLIPGPGRWLLNALSLHGIYRSRIEETWVIAARPEPPEAQPSAIRLANWQRVWSRPGITLRDIARAAANHGPASPYPLICTTLSFPGNRGDPKLLDRKGEAFVIAPLYSGSALTRWRPTEELPDLAGLTLAGASAISGAAVSPNMGERTSPTISIVTTLFNARLGQWVDNPRQSRRNALHRLAVEFPLVLYGKEMLGRAARDDGYVYLSDGGHFENLGLYELLRRRCKYIVAVAADVEPADMSPLGFGNIGTAVRLARVDFGVEVDFPELRPMLRDPVTGFVTSYYAVARIRYPTPGGHADEGTLVLVKSALSARGLPPDILSYWRTENPGFPYDPTLDQQLDQPQFESYRQLGFLAGRQAFEAARHETSLDKQFDAINSTFASTDWYTSDLVEAIRSLRPAPA